MDHKQYIQKLHEALKKIPSENITSLASNIKEIRKSGRTVFIAGNGGSSATASHMVSDFQKTVLGHNYDIKERISAISLTDNVPLLTAWANDYGYEHVLSQQLVGIASPGDLLIVITASGNSPNIVEVVRKAKEMNMKTFGLIGFTGGAVKELLDGFIHIESNDYGIVEDAHSVIGHIITEILKSEIQV